VTIYTFLPTPIGELLVAKNQSAEVTEIHFTVRPERPSTSVGEASAKMPARGDLPAARTPAARDGWQRDDTAFDDVTEQLRAYFAGTLREFDLPLALEGTSFQQSVWSVLQTIPYGETRSYLDVARAIGKPAACRAVGAANGANPIPIVVPCHRVIGSGGGLTGFGGGIDVKRRLLALEARNVMPLFAARL
jgi:methylated-DNA-[protein]-cysteine S-methyltransferase